MSFSTNQQIVPALVRLIVSYPKAWLVVFAVVLAVILPGLAHVRIDSTIEGFLDKDSSAIKTYDAFKTNYGRDEFFLITADVPDLYDPVHLRNLQAFHHDLALNVPHVSTVDSLANARDIYADEDDLVVEELLEELPSSAEEIEALREKIDSHPLYTNSYVSEDRKTVAFVIRLVNQVAITAEDGSVEYVLVADDELKQSMAGIEAAVDRHQSHFSRISIAGSPALTAELSRSMGADFGLFSGLAMLLVVVMLSLMFRRVSAVVIPLVVLNLAIMATLAVMGLRCEPMQLTTTMLTSFLLAVCVGDCVHLMHSFFRQYDTGSEKTQAVEYALNHAMKALFFTTLTTAAGLASFSISDLYPVAALGIYGALGTAFGFIFTIFLVPPLFVLLPIKRRAINKTAKTPILQRAVDGLIERCVNIAIDSAYSITSIAVVLFIVCASIIPQIEFTHDAREWFKDGTPIKQAMFDVEEKMQGSMPIEVVVKTSKPNGALDPVLLARVKAFSNAAVSYDFGKVTIGNAASLADLVEETHTALVPADGALPSTAALVRQELLLVELSKAEELYRFTNGDFSELRITLIHTWSDAMHHDTVLKSIQALANQHIGEEYDIHLTGLTTILGKTFAEMLETTVKSYALAAVIIALSMMLMLRSASLGLLSMLPNLLPIMVTLVVMHLMNAPLDMFSMLIGSIAIGLTVDDTVHFMLGFQRYHDDTGDYRVAIAKTLNTYGKAMTTTTIILATSFLIYCFSEMNNLWDFGLYTSLCIVLALLSDLILAPAIMAIRHGKPLISFGSVAA
ncbi:Uncharacterised protein [BD1-7 clade bacterium]|uniref:SSD domain-containing protein n=1 Tax=BD1-7 clade bacterium TaxID=2029982 RepID=A0A5S9R0B2_9GAMM|nr:Uncharacterised protein [BD1-7 clade bacterium]